MYICMYWISEEGKWCELGKGTRKLNGDILKGGYRVCIP